MRAQLGFGIRIGLIIQIFGDPVWVKEIKGEHFFILFYFKCIFLKKNMIFRITE